jgi:hypothetical protein
MQFPLDIMERELRARGYETRRETATTASSKTDALRAVRALQKALKTNSLKGIGYTALYGIYELARLRTAGKKLSDGQKAAILATFKQLKKSTSFFGKLKSLLKRSQTEQGSDAADIDEIEKWLVSDEGFGAPPGSAKSDAPAEKPRRPRGWMPSEQRQQAEKEFYGDRPLRRKYGKRVSASELVCELEDGESFVGFDFQDSVATASTASNTLRMIKMVEKIIASKRGRKATLALIMGIHGILKAAAKNRKGRLDRTDAKALKESIDKIKNVKKPDPELNEELDRLEEQLGRDRYYAQFAPA